MSGQPWEKYYPAGLSWQDPLPPPFSLCGILKTSSERWPKRTAIEFYGAEFNYRVLFGLAARASKGLQQIGVGPDVNVALHLPNTPHFVTCFFGTLLAGGRVVNCNPSAGLDELRSQLRDSGAKVLVTADWLPSFPDLGRLDEVNALDAVVKCRLTDFLAPELAEKLVRSSSQPKPSLVKEVDFRRVISNDGARYAHPRGRHEEDVVVLQYTGATTGEPKGAMLTTANLSAAIQIFSQLKRAHRRAAAVKAAGAPGPDRMATSRATVAPAGSATAAAAGTNAAANAAANPGATTAPSIPAAAPAPAPAAAPAAARRVLVAVPLCHIFGLNVMLTALSTGNELLLHLRFDAGQVIADIASKRVNKFAGVPTMLSSLANHAAFGDADLSSLASWGSGGAPLPAEVRKQLETTSERRLADAYGLTETTGLATLPIGGHAWKPGQVGVPVPMTLVEIVDLDSGMQLLPAGEVGEICVTGPQVMRGYWNRPEETRHAFRGGRFHTGDIGFMDADGIVTLTGRKKEMLLIGGHNVYPRNVERAIHEHPAVLDVAVIGIPDRNFGQVVKAFIVLKAGCEPFTQGALCAFLGKRLASYELPAALEFRPELPRTAIGKLSKRSLEEEELTRRQVV